MNLLKRSRDYQRFVILSRGRSGSNYLRGLLNSHEAVVVYGELFRDWDEVGWEVDSLRRAARSKKLVRMMRTDPVKLIERYVYCGYASPVKAVGFKLFYYHARRSGQRDIWTYLRNDPSIRIVHLVRMNELRRLVSERRAAATDRWTNLSGDTEPPFRVRLDPEECLLEFERERGMKDEAECFFPTEKLLRISYEDLCADQDAVTARVQSFLGLERRRSTARTFRQTTEPLPDIITNYWELKRRFGGTPWACFFNE